MNTGMIILNFGMAFAAPVMGRVLDLYPARAVVAASAACLGLSLVALGLSQNIWLSAAVLGIPLAIGIVGSGTLTAMTLVARWFTVHRGRAIAVTAIGMSLGSVVLPPLVGTLVSSFSWRTALMLLGCLLGGATLAMVPFIKDRPGPLDVEPGSDCTLLDGTAVVVGAASQPIRTSQLLRTRDFWTITLSGALTFGALQTISLSLVPLAQAHGLSVTEAATLLSVVGGTAIVGKLALAWLGDRLNRRALLVSLFGLVMLSSGALMISESRSALLICSALLGLAAGAIHPAFLALLADRFGPVSFGTVNGAATFFMSTIGAACIRFGGEVFDRTGTYDAMFATFIVLGAASVILMVVSRSSAGQDRSL
jgi:MFS family permease